MDSVHPCFVLCSVLSASLLCALASVHLCFVLCCASLFCVPLMGTVHLCSVLCSVHPCLVLCSALHIFALCSALCSVHPCRVLHSQLLCILALCSTLYSVLPLCSAHAETLIALCILALCPALRLSASLLGALLCAQCPHSPCSARAAHIPGLSTLQAQRLLQGCRTAPACCTEPGLWLRIVFPFCLCPLGCGRQEQPQLRWLHL